MAQNTRARPAGDSTRRVPGVRCRGVEAAREAAAAVAQPGLVNALHDAAEDASITLTSNYHAYTCWRPVLLPHDSPQTAPDDACHLQLQISSNVA